MVATDVASRGIGMIDHSTARPFPLPCSLLRRVTRSMRSSAFCHCVLCKCYHCLVQACHDLFWLRCWKLQSILCSVVRYISHSVSICTVRVPRRIGTSLTCQAAYPRIFQDHATLWTWILWDFISLQRAMQKAVQIHDAASHGLHWIRFDFAPRGRMLTPLKMLRTFLMSSTMTTPTTQKTTCIVLVVQVVLEQLVQPSRCSPLRVRTIPADALIRCLTNALLQTPSKRVTS